MQPCKVVANSQRLTVLKNLHQALSAFTDVFEREDVTSELTQFALTRRADLEKTSQTQSMKSINENASDIFAWLIPHTKHSDIAIDA